MYINTKARNTTPKKRPNVWKWVVLAVVILLAAAVVLKLTVFKTPAKGAESGNTGSQSTKGEPLSSPPSTSSSGSSSSKGSSSSSSTTGSQPGDTKSDTGGSAATLVQPTGQFVSDHAPGATHPTETSVCNTTPGAKCQIIFTKDGVTKSLPAQTTDRGGSTYWNNWNPSASTPGLTPGSWQVQAIATLNGQTKSATDAIPLVISQ